MAARARRAVGGRWSHAWRILGALAVAVLLAPATEAASRQPPAPGQLAWWAARLAALDKPARVAEAQAALADDRWRRTRAELAQSSGRAQGLEQERRRAAGDLARIELERELLAQERRAVECRVGAALAAFGRRQPASGRELSRARLVLADMVRVVTGLRARAQSLAASRAQHSLALRAAAGAVVLRRAEAAAGGRQLRADEQARLAATQARTEIEVHRRAVRRAMAALAADLDAIAALDLGRTPQPAAMIAAHKDHKRAIALEYRLDRRLLRAVGGWPGADQARRPPAGPGAAGPPPAGIAGLLMPIAGVIEPRIRLPGGGPAPGLSIVTGVAQTVSAPAGGKVAYAAPFPGFGLLLIIDEGRGYHVVLSGMTRLDVRQGASVVAGQAVGGVAAPGDEPARLYVELRYRGLPVHPAPWLAAHQDKVRS